MTTTTDTARRLIGLSPEHRVVSMYIDLNPEQFATPAARSSEITSLIDAARRDAEGDDSLSHDEKVALREDIERISQYLDNPDTEGARSLAVFCSRRDDLFEVIQLPRQVPMGVVIDRRPYVEPLVAAATTRRWLVALVNRSRARFFVGDRDRLTEQTALDSDVHGQHDQGGWSQARYERSVEKEVDDHLHQVAETLRRSFRRRRFDRFALGGPSEVVARLDRMLEETDVRAGLVERRVEIDVENSTDDEVTEAAAAVIADEERQRERAALDRMAAGVGRGSRVGAEQREPDAGGHGAGGPEETVEALNERRVETLLLATAGRSDSDAVQRSFDRDGGRCPACGLLTLEPQRSCPADGTRVEPVSLREAAIEAAIAQDAEIVLVTDHPDLGPFQGIGAVLRF
jgi:peptide subunit release factor 1 (eRF1)